MFKHIAQSALTCLSDIRKICMSQDLQADDPILQPLLVGNHMLPGIWRYVMPQEFLHLRFPEECRSKCLTCPKVSSEGFRADYRCCTYQPRVPNYLLGLASQTSSGQAALQTAASRGLLLPEGMQQTPRQWYHYLQDLTDDRFGKSERVLCPMLDASNGLCRIHAFRNSVCSTFFCLRDHGSLSEKFWAQLQSLGSQVEMVLSQWALRELGFDLEAYIELLNRWGDEALADQVHDQKLADGWALKYRKALWGKWYGREIELYQETAKLIATHRDHLWDIANQHEILEAKRFDRSMIASVPSHLDSQIEDSDREISDEDETMVPPQELWGKVLQSYQRLWQLPAGTYRLARRVSLTKNDRKDAEEKLYSSQDYCLKMHESPRSRAIDWRLFLSPDQYRILQLFQEPRLLNWRTLLLPQAEALPNAREFLSEMIASRVIVKLPS